MVACLEIRFLPGKKTPAKKYFSRAAQRSTTKRNTPTPTRHARRPEAFLCVSRETNYISVSH